MQQSHVCLMVSVVDMRFLPGLVLGFVSCLLTVCIIIWVTDMLQTLISIIPILVIAGLIFPLQTALSGATSQLRLRNAERQRNDIYGSAWEDGCSSTWPNVW